jgi:hypothetical protein
MDCRIVVGGGGVGQTDVGTGVGWVEVAGRTHVGAGVDWLGGPELVDCDASWFDPSVDELFVRYFRINATISLSLSACRMAN